jgi:hypothetical protein
MPSVARRMTSTAETRSSAESRRQCRPSWSAASACVVKLPLARALRIEPDHSAHDDALPSESRARLASARGGQMTPASAIINSPVVRGSPGLCAVDLPWRPCIARHRPRPTAGQQSLPRFRPTLQPTACTRQEDLHADSRDMDAICPQSGGCYEGAELRLTPVWMSVASETVR